MPPFVPLADGVQAEFIFSLGGQLVENRLWFISRFPPFTSLQLGELLAGLAAWHTDFIMPALSQDLTLEKVTVSDWTSDPPPLIFTTFPNVTGGVTSAAHSANVSIRVAFKGTDDQTFPNNANFVPGIPKDNVLLNTYDETIRTALFEGYTALIDLAGTFSDGNIWRWVITSRRVDNDWRDEQLALRMVSVLFPSPYVSPRRHRLAPQPV